MDFIKPGPNKRVCAYVIDYSFLMLFDVVSLQFTGQRVFWMIPVLYIILKDSLNGQSFGKRLVGIQILDQEGNSASVGTTMLRNLIFILPIFPLVEYVVMLRNQDGKRLGDLWAKTIVTDLNPEKKDNYFLWVSIVVMLANLIVSGLMIASLSGQMNPLIQK